MTAEKNVHVNPSPIGAAGPMKGVRVLDLGVWVAGPFAATMLADFGAEVIKIEPPGVGDPMRHGNTLDGPSAHWCTDGRNKKSVTLNLRSEAGQGVLAELIKRSDVLIDNHRPGLLDAWGFGKDRLQALNPGLIVSLVSGFGQNGPYAHRLAFDRIASAMGGLLNLNGFPDRPPVRTGIILADYLSALFNAIGILMALYQRDAGSKSGTPREQLDGERIDVAMYECVFRILENTLPLYDKRGIERERNGNLSQGFYPDDMFQTQDEKWVVLTAVTDQQFAGLCEAMGQPELAADPAFATLSARGSQVERLQVLIGDWVRARPCAEVMAGLEKARVPFSEVMTVSSALADPHYAAREAIIDVDDPQYGPLKQPAVTPRLERNPGAVYRGAPTLGSDTEQVLREIAGLDDAAIERLREQAVI